MVDRSESHGRAHALLLALSLGCQNVDHPPPFTTPIETDDGSAGANGEAPPQVVLPNPDPSPGPPAPDGSTACGRERIPAVVDRPNLYFVIDRSGSMAETISPVSNTEKYAAARRAIGSVLRAIGHRVRYGAMVFPGGTKGTSACDAGQEIYPLTQGDPLGDRNPDSSGPNLRVLLTRLLSYTPEGGTPTAATLAAAREQLSAQPGRSVLVLATDGAPNCNPELLSCSTEHCIPDLEQAVLISTPPLVCGKDVACCEEGVLSDPGPTVCMDDEATLTEVEALSAASIPTYVIGMPGSEAYARVLGTWARAGGTARGDTGYYAVGDETELTDALLEIGAGLSIGCEIGLTSTPEDPEFVNLYFDGVLVPRDPENGWDWSGQQQLPPDELQRMMQTGDASIVLQGEACNTLKTGNIVEVQVVYGCQTIVR